MKKLYEYGTIRLCGEKRVEFEKQLIEVNARRQVLGLKALSRGDFTHFSAQTVNINKAVKYEP